MKFLIPVAGFLVAAVLSAPLATSAAAQDAPTPPAAPPVAAATPVAAAPASTTVIATVNGKSITEADLQLAEEDIGQDLGQLPPETKRFALTEFLIENELLANEAEKAELADSPMFANQMAYWRRRALRNSYFEQKIRPEISEKVAETFYQDQVKQLQPEEEVKARHILVETLEEAESVKKRLDDGGDFEQFARDVSKDPGSKANGGLLGYFSRGQMVPAFEAAAFKLEKGQLSSPVKSRFGYHIIKLEDRRTKPVPTFDEVKERIMNSMVYQKQQAMTEAIRKNAKVEYLDPTVKEQVAARDAQASEQQKLIQEQIEKLKAADPDDAPKDSGTEKK